ncbi:endoglycosidase [Bacteroidia bacterium]|nr:endoglycosidase [Bacteroidia bacterium]
MKINSLKVILLAVTAVGALFTGCSDWTEVENIGFGDSDLNETNKSEEFYASLRAWKQTPDLPQSFVWFDDWTGISPMGANSLRGLPDSLTIASNWGQPKWGLTEMAKADMKYVQEVKGTKVVVTLFSAACGEDVPEDSIYNIGNSSDPAVIGPAIRKYAETIYDLVVKEGYDGFDWDYEPSGGGGSGHYLWTNKVQRKLFVEELSYWFGKGSQRTDRDGRKPAKPGLLFLIDGEVGIGGRMDKDWLSYYVDYFVLQAYGSGSDYILQYRVNGVLSDMSNWISSGIITENEVVRRTIVTENFESYASTGGGVLVQSKYIHKTDNIDCQIGGFGIYRVGFDYNQGMTYNNSPEYYYLRQGITNLYRIYNERKNAPAPAIK